MLRRIAGEPSSAAFLHNTQRQWQPCMPRLQSWSWHNNLTLSHGTCEQLSQPFGLSLDGRVSALRLCSLKR